MRRNGKHVYKYWHPIRTSHLGTTTTTTTTSTVCRAQRHPHAITKFTGAPLQDLRAFHITSHTAALAHHQLAAHNAAHSTSIGSSHPRTLPHSPPSPSIADIFIAPISLLPRPDSDSYGLKYKQRCTRLDNPETRLPSFLPLPFLLLLVLPSPFPSS
jgi:hypothetical protein